MFGTVGQEAEITNVGLLDVDITGNNRVGGLVGDNSGGGTITNSYATGTASGNNNVGGLVGLNIGGAITNSYAAGLFQGLVFK